MVDIKKSMDEKFPGSLATKFIDKQKHPLALCIFWAFIIIVIICLVAVLDGSGRYSHPFYKHSLITSCKTHVTSKQEMFIKRGVMSTDQHLQPRVYQLEYSPKKNILTMQVGDKGNKVLEKAQHGQQLRQMQVTNIQMNLIAQSRQMSQTLRDKKLGMRIESPKGNLLAFSQNGHLRYSVLPTLPSIK